MNFKEHDFDGWSWGRFWERVVGSILAGLIVITLAKLVL